MKILLQSLVVPHVEYACVVWSPFDVKHINLLEGVQRYFTSKFGQFRSYEDDVDMIVCTTEYPERLKALKIYSLQRRRERYIILYLFKVMINLVPNPGVEFRYSDRTNCREIQNVNPSSSNWTRRLRMSSFFMKGQDFLIVYPIIYG